MSDQPGTIHALYGGWCTWCGDEIIPGMTVVYQHRGWVHVECRIDEPA